MVSLEVRAGDIRAQLAELTARRRELIEQRALMSSGEGAGHDARIATIDQRSAALEKELFQTQDAIAQASAGRVVRTNIFGGGTLQDPNTLSQRDVQRAVSSAVRDGVASTVFSVLVLYAGWRGFRRFVLRRKPSPSLGDNSMQIAQLQQSIDVIALEVERISEGQRYVARILGDRAVGPGAAQPVAVPKGEPVGASERRQ